MRFFIASLLIAGTLTAKGEVISLPLAVHPVLTTAVPVTATSGTRVEGVVRYIELKNRTTNAVTVAVTANAPTTNYVGQVLYTGVVTALESRIGTHTNPIYVAGRTITLSASASSVVDTNQAVKAYVVYEKE